VSRDTNARRDLMWRTAVVAPFRPTGELLCPQHRPASDSPRLRSAQRGDAVCHRDAIVLALPLWHGGKALRALQMNVDTIRHRRRS